MSVVKRQAITPRSGVVEIDFDESRHIYSLNGRRMISVTQLLKSAGLLNDQWYTEFGATRGTYVAEAIALDNGGILDESSVGPLIMPYVSAWRAFRREHVANVISSETTVCDPDLLLAGTIDSIVVGKPSPAMGPYRWILDCKTGAAEAWHQLQLVAYAMMLPYGQDCRLADIYLAPDGSYKINAWIDRIVLMRSRNIIRAALNLVRWKDEHGIASEPAESPRDEAADDVSGHGGGRGPGPAIIPGGSSGGG